MVRWVIVVVLLLGQVALSANADPITHAPLPRAAALQPSQAVPLVAFRQNHNVYVMNADGENVRSVTTDGDPDAYAYPTDHTTYDHFAWSPDGAYLLLVRSDHHADISVQRDLLLWDAASGETRVIASSADQPLEWPSWAVDANVITAVTDQHEVNIGTEAEAFRSVVVQITPDGELSPLATIDIPSCTLPSGWLDAPSDVALREEHGFHLEKVRPRLQYSVVEETIVAYRTPCSRTLIANLATGETTVTEYTVPFFKPPDQLVMQTRWPYDVDAELVITDLALSDAGMVIGPGEVPAWSVDGDSVFLVQRELFDEQSLASAEDGRSILSLLFNYSTIMRVPVDGSEPTEIVTLDAYAIGTMAEAPGESAIIASVVENPHELWEHRLAGDTYTRELLELYGPRTHIVRVDIETGDVEMLMEDAGRPAVQPNIPTGQSETPNQAERDDETPNVIALEPDEAEPNTTDAATIEDPNGLLAYTGTDGNIWVIRSDGTEPHQVTTDGTPEAPYIGPRWSPDGTMLVFERGTGSEQQTFLYRDGSLSVVPGIYGCRLPTFTATNDRLAYHCATLVDRAEDATLAQLQSDPSLGFVSTSNLDGSDWRIEIPYTLDGMPRWGDTSGRQRLYAERIEYSPDGSLVLVNTFGMRQYTELYDLTGTTPAIRLADGVGVFDREGQSVIVAICDGGCGPGDRRVPTTTYSRYDLDGNVIEVIHVTPPESRGGRAAISPDGQLFLFGVTQIDADGPTFQIMSMDGSEVSTIPLDVTLHWDTPDWQPVAAPLTRPTPGAAPIIEPEQPTPTAAPPTQTPTPESAPAGAFEGPYAGWIIYGAKQQGQWDLFATNPATGQTEQLTDGPADEWAPAWWEFGRTLIYLSDASGTAQVMIMNFETGQISQHTNWTGPGEIWYAVPTGHHLEFVLTIVEPSSAWLATLSLGSGTITPFYGPWASFPSFGPSYEYQMPYVTWVSGETDIMLLQPDGSVIGLATTTANEDAPQISPDGSRVAYNVENASGRQIAVVTIATGATILLPQIGDDSNPVWSVDGQQIAFVSNVGGVETIYVASSDGSGMPTPLAGVPSFEQVWYLAWAA